MVQCQLLLDDANANDVHASICMSSRFQINQVIEANWQQRALLWQKRWLGDRDQLARLLAAAGQHLSVK
ncbi:hypothetical protein T09_14328 [Trichinella sp. T9]|uniref:Uncharacterized protein n=1 Tax=Trichinella murrelli TaxID=144512 RepID=A0A0V0U9Q3_9BILA|nr:hypothetical protein T05_10609 [Trichinella murrelli]KRX65367.1 hypothetical protein T09_14328 [Trichinella sp. T9]